LSAGDAKTRAVFPLNTVIFPGGELPLRIFEPRYQDMVANCLRNGEGFVVVAIREGAEVGAPATPYSIGTEVRVSDWDSGPDGLLNIVCTGVAKVQLSDDWLQDDGLRLAIVEHLPKESDEPAPQHFAILWELIEELGLEVPAGEHNARWLSARLTERLPLTLAMKQRLLSMSDPCERLREINNCLPATMRA